MPRRPDFFLSVVIPSYNAARFIGAAVASVLSQPDFDGEIIIVDDGSTDGSVQTIRGLPGPIRLVEQQNSGAAAARNRGVAVAEGEFLAFLDADDLWTPVKLATQLPILESPAAPDMVFGGVRQFRHRRPFEKWPVQNGLIFGCLILRRANFFRVGPVRTDLKVGEFLDWFARAREAGLTHLSAPEVCLLRRIHDDNLSIRERAATGDFLKVIKASLDRRRIAGALPKTHDERPDGNFFSE